MALSSSTSSLPPALSRSARSAMSAAALRYDVTSARSLISLTIDSRRSGEDESRSASKETAGRFEAEGRPELMKARPDLHQARSGSTSVPPLLTCVSGMGY
mgnify:CR=1 FL=1